MNWGRFGSNRFGKSRDSSTFGMSLQAVCTIKGSLVKDL